MTTRRPIEFHGRIVKVRTERVELPNGERLDVDIVDHPGGAAIVAVDEQNQVCLLDQHRHVFGRRLREIPAGRLDTGENPLETAKRELAEEAGLEADQWDSLGRMISSPGVFTEVVHLYLARGLSRTATAVETGEIFTVGWRPLAAAGAAALAGEIEDAKTVIALLRACAFLGVAAEA